MTRAAEGTPKEEKFQRQDVSGRVMKSWRKLGIARVRRGVTGNDKKVVKVTIKTNRTLTLFTLYFSITDQLLLDCLQVVCASLASLGIEGRWPGLLSQ